jgi:hypothetical protein
MYLKAKVQFCEFHRAYEEIICWFYFFNIYEPRHDKTNVMRLSGSGGLVVKVSASQPGDHGFGPYSGHDHVSLYDTSTGWFREADSKVINISCKNLFRNRA